jgi:hypothetical protein
LVDPKDLSIVIERRNKRMAYEIRKFALRTTLVLSATTLAACAHNAPRVATSAAPTAPDTTAPWNRNVAKVAGMAPVYDGVGRHLGYVKDADLESPKFDEKGQEVLDLYGANGKRIGTWRPPALDSIGGPIRVISEAEPGAVSIDEKGNVVAVAPSRTEVIAGASPKPPAP